ncbi:hypothetical protein D3C80_1136900 [compost metagenome]
MALLEEGFAVDDGHHLVGGGLDAADAVRAARHGGVQVDQAEPVRAVGCCAVHVVASYRGGVWGNDTVCMRMLSIQYVWNQKRILLAGTIPPT